MKVLSVNAGSSSLKFRLYEMPQEEVLMKGTFERIGSDEGHYDIKIGEEKVSADVPLPSHETAVQILVRELSDRGVISSLDEIKAIGHRIVHGGSLYHGSVIATEEVVDNIEALSGLAPLHNPAHVLGIRAFKKEIPSATSVACFDTAFHQTMEEENFLYPVPYEWYQKHGVRKYGFHGLSHQYITERMQELLGKNDVRLIICHIGNGASVTAVKDSKCIDTSMGFTPNAGVMMGTRCGDIDYSILPFMAKKAGLSLGEIDQVLNKKSGLEGIASKNDLRDLDEAYEKGEEKAVLAFRMYTKRIAEYIARYYIELDGKVDAICFTAGGGENDPLIRKLTVERLLGLGITLDDAKNDEMLVRKGKEGVISQENSSVPVYVLGTDEELMIARETFHLV